MRMEDIEKALKELAKTSDLFKKVCEGLNMYKECDTYSYKYFANDLESQNFANVTELKQYIEMICLDN